jgi:DNA-binding transcriptional ArsR family regulator
MVEYPAESLNRVFHALADPTRRAILRALTPGERTIGELSAPFAMTFAAASKHVKVLEGAGLVERRILGRSHFCRLQPAPLAAADSWLHFYERYWTDRIDRLEQHFNPQGDSSP